MAKLPVWSALGGSHVQPKLRKTHESYLPRRCRSPLFGGKETKIWTHGLLAGIVPLTKVDAGKTCGKAAVSKVETKASFVNMLVAGVTFSIYSPMTVVVTCKG